MSKNLNLLQYFEELAPILEMIHIHVIEQKGKIAFCHEDGTTTILKRNTDRDSHNFSGKSNRGFIMLSVSKDKKKMYCFLGGELTILKNNNTLYLSFYDCNQKHYQITLSDNSFTMNLPLVSGGKVTLWASKEKIDESQYFRLMMEEELMTSKVEIVANPDDTLITAKATTVDTDGEEYLVGAPVMDSKKELEQWIYDMCYPYQGISYFQDVLDAFESVLPGITGYFAERYSFFEQIARGDNFKDQSHDLLALSMDSLLAPLGLMKQEPIKEKYLRLRNRNLDEK